MSTASMALGVVALGGLNMIQFFRKRFIDIGIGTALVRQTVPGADQLIDPVVTGVAARAASAVVPQVFFQVKNWAAATIANPRQLAARLSNLNPEQVLTALPFVLTAAGAAYAFASLFTANENPPKQETQIEQLLQIVRALRSDQAAEIRIDPNGTVILLVSTRSGTPSAG